MILRPKSNIINNRNEIIFQAIDWRSSDVAVEEDTDNTDNNDDDGFNAPSNIIKHRKFQIRGYGVTEEGHSISITINDFTPYFFFKIPQDWSIRDFKYFINALQSKVNNYHQDSLISSDIVKRKDFYGFTNNKLYKFGRLVFKNLNGFYLYQKAFKYPIYVNRLKKKFDFSKELYENKVNPLLRFFHIKNIEPVGWIKLPALKYVLNIPKTTRCQIDCSIHYDDIEYINKNKISKLLVAAFDIECTSKDGSFPNPNRKEDEIIQIATTVFRFGEDTCALKHIVTLKKCDPIDGAIVESYYSEKDLLIAWVKFLEKLDPDIMTGYNIWGFDEEYIYERAKTGNGGQIRDYSEILMRRLSRQKDGKCQFKEKELSSSALGNNFLKFFDIEGVVQIDLLKVIQKDYKLNSYKLNNVASVFMGQNKLDLTPKQLFANYKDGASDKIKEIGVYCIMDCILCNNLINKLKVIENNSGMGNVCIVPFEYLFLRGQGIKIFSPILKQCRSDNFLIKTLCIDDIDQNSYEGAIVFSPDPGIYFDQVTVMDYAALYPSSMIAENISHDSILGFKEYRLKKKNMKSEPDEYELHHDTINNEFDNLEDYTYNDIEYDVFTGIGDDKTKIGYKVCRFAENKNGEKSVLPRILMKLLKARKDTRSRIKYKTVKTKDGTEYSGMLKEGDDAYTISTVLGNTYIVNKCDVVGDIIDTNNEFEKAVLDGLQLSYKVTCNSLYGQVGATTSSICYKELAACTTATGRDMVIVARDITLKNYKGSKLVYGDSITGDEPVILRNTFGLVEIKTIESLSNEWDQYENFKPFDTIESNRREKQKAFVKYDVWSNGKWNPITKVIRHKNNKKIYRVNTECGIVDVTEDHSLLDENMRKIKPKDCVIGETLLAHSYPTFNDYEKPNDLTSIIEIIDKYDNEERTINDKMAFIYGVFYGSGNCVQHDTTQNLNRNTKYTWSITNQDNKLLNMCNQYLLDIYGNKTSFKILDTCTSSGINKLVPVGHIKCMVEEFLPLFYDKYKYKKVPDMVINGDYKTRLNFFIGYCASNSPARTNERNSINKTIRFQNKGKVGSAGLYYIAKSLGYIASIQQHRDKLNIYSISCYLSDNVQQKNKNLLKKMVHLRDTKNDEFVYDLETENGNFNAGVGELTLKNTDSVFISFSQYIKEKYGEDLTDVEMMEKTIEVGKEAGAMVTATLKEPQVLEYEKVFWPFIIFSKKRYVGNKYEFDPHKFKQTSMGIVLKRRDNADIVKDIYGGIIDLILNKRDIEGSKEFFRKEVNKLLLGDVNIDKLIVTKSIRGNYANPTLIPHKALADRMGLRDPGNKPASSDRIPYCYIDKSNLTCTICDGVVNYTKCKCLECMEIYCSIHLNSHRDTCKRICRFCKIPAVRISLTNCKTCWGWYCVECLKKHKRRMDKYKEVHYDKCKKMLSQKITQSDIVEQPKYINEQKLSIDYNYYLEHQIKKPVFQIFQLTMKTPSVIINDIVRKDTNKRNGNREITKWFTVIKDKNSLGECGLVDVMTEIDNIKIQIEKEKNKFKLIKKGKKILIDKKEKII